MTMTGERVEGAPTVGGESEQGERESQRGGGATRESESRGDKRDS